MFIVQKQAKPCADPMGFMHTDWQYEVQIPVGKEHPGAFGFERKNHIHEGVDIYTKPQELVYLPQALWVHGWIDFTGPSVGMPWWNDTKALVCHTQCGKTILFGEIVPSTQGLSEQVIPGWYEQGHCIGQVHPVLTKDKGRPRHMVHVEMYDRVCYQSVGLWQKGNPKPDALMDPTDWLLGWAQC